MKLGVLGDIHLFTLKVHPRRLLSKRALGHVNLALNRRKRFEHALLPAMLERLRHLDADLTLMSGDVSTSSLESEFGELRELMVQGGWRVTDGGMQEGPDAEVVEEELGDKAHCDMASGGCGIVLVPGNHDRYTFKSRRTRRIETALAGMMPDAFPHWRKLRGGWSLLALDSAVPNRVLSRGVLGREQTDGAIDRINTLEKGDGLVVLCHYPCVVPKGVPSGWTHDLAEAKLLRSALSGAAQRGARVLFIHGHVHKPWYVAGPKGVGRRFECLNAGSPCLKSSQYPRGQGFWELTLADDPLADGAVAAVHHVPREPGDGQPGDKAGLAWETRAFVDAKEMEHASSEPAATGAA